MTSAEPDAKPIRLSDLSFRLGLVEYTYRTEFELELSTDLNGDGLFGIGDTLTAIEESRDSLHDSALIGKNMLLNLSLTVPFEGNSRVIYVADWSWLNPISLNAM